MPSSPGLLILDTYARVARTLSGPSTRHISADKMVVPLEVRQATNPSTGDNTIAARTSYAAISLLCMLTMAGFLGTYPK